MIFTIDTIGKTPEAKKAVVEAPPIDPKELEELGRLRSRLPASQVVDDLDDEEALR